MTEKFKICLTGGIASGKTYVSDKLASLGMYVIDADILAREVVAKNSSGLSEVTAVFGPRVLQEDGSLNRKVLKALVFSDDKKLQQLNQILHPLIRKAFVEKSMNNNLPIELWVIPLFKGEVYQGFDRVLVVDVPEQTQIERMQNRDHVSVAVAKKILASQPSRIERLKLATDVINNRFTLEKLDRHVDRIFKLYSQLSLMNHLQ